MSLVPDLEWYSELSERRGVTARCPFATVEACPRYFQSLSLLGGAGSTPISAREDERLVAFWSKSDLWPRTDEQATTVMGSDKNPSIYSRFCPEVAFERFGYFATTLTRYADEIDSGFAHQQLSKEHASPRDARWAWQTCQPQHYTDCPVYAVLRHRAGAASAPPVQHEPWWRKYLAELIVALVVCIVGFLLTAIFG